MMKNIVRALSIAVIVFSLAACGEADEISKPVYKSGDNGIEDSDITEGSIVPSLTEKENDGSYHYLFELKNTTSESIRLTMNTSQLYDYHLLTDQGTVVYTYSDDKFFAQMLQEKTIQPGESLQIEVDASEGLSTLPAGTSTLEVWSTANEAKDWKTSTKVQWDGNTDKGE